MEKKLEMLKKFSYSTATTNGPTSLEFTLNVDNHAHLTAYEAMLKQAILDVRQEVHRLNTKTR